MERGRWKLVSVLIREVLAIVAVKLPISVAEDSKNVFATHVTI